MVRRRRARVLVLAALPVAWVAAGVAAALVATAPRPAAIAPRADIAGVPVEDVAVTAGGATVRGWLATANPLRCVVLAAGIHGNRTHLVDRAAWWLSRGISTLLVDLRGTGASDPVPIGFGFCEADDLAAWHAFLRGRGVATIGVHAQSLGAAAACYAAARVPWAFAVLEQPYDDVLHALSARLPWVPFPRVVLWPMIAAAGWRLGVDAGDLRPVDAVRALRGPCLLLAGTADRTPTRAQTEAVFAAIGSERKMLCWLDGAGHEDLWAFDRERCSAAIRDLDIVD